MATTKPKIICTKCGRALADTEYYTYKDGSKMKMCKKCLTMHIDNYNPETFTWILKDLDVPYIEGEWNILRDRAFEKDPYNMNGLSVVGKYISKMKLKQWREYTWADTEKLKALQEERDKQAQIDRENSEAQAKIDFENGDISQAEYETIVSTETQHKDNMSKPAPAPLIGANNQYNEDNFLSEEDIDDPAQELTKEDKIYLALKWGRLYKPSEWLALEKDYKDMTDSFDIQDADTINTLKLICKTNLKANQALDCGDVDGFQKLARVQESLRKSAKFTAAQNKEAKNDFVDAIGELFVICERDGGFIPRFPTDPPQDKVDLTLKDMESYVYKLVTQDLGFGKQIEDSLRKIQIQKEMNETEDKNNRGEDTSLTNEDYEQFRDDTFEQMEEDVKMYLGEDEEDGS